MNLRRALFVLPNLFTLSSIFCGFDAIRVIGSAPSAQQNPLPYYQAALLLVFAMFFDSIDGRVARLTKTQSAFGVQIDSLADVISFGVAPAYLIYRWAFESIGFFGVLLSFAYCACAAIRLARFNVLATNPKGTPAKPGKFIVGLPTPGSAGVIFALIIATRGKPFLHHNLMIGLVMLLSFLMVSTVRFRSFKDIKMNARTGAMIFFAIGSTVAVSVRYGAGFALPWILTWYIAIALIETVVTFPKRRAALREQRRLQALGISTNIEE